MNVKIVEALKDRMNVLSQLLLFVLLNELDILDESTFEALFFYHHKRILISWWQQH